MTPIKAKSLIPKTAQLTGFTEEQVTAVINFYYKYVREKLSNLDEIKIKLENFGDFYLKERATEREKAKCTNIKKYMELKPNSPRVEAILRNVTQQLERIKHVEELQEKDKEFKAKKRKIKEAYVAAKTKETLEGQMENPESNV